MGEWKVPSPMPPPEELRRLYTTDLMSSVELCRKFRCSKRTLNKSLLAAGVTLRKRGPRSPKHHGSWTGGRIVDKLGYILLYAPDHPSANSGGYVREHRLVMEVILERHLLDTEVVDHINGSKDDNRPENLRVFASNAEHLKATMTGKIPNWSPEGRANIGKRGQGKGRKWKRKPPQPKPTGPSPTASDVPVSS